MPLEFLLIELIRRKYLSLAVSSVSIYLEKLFECIRRLAIINSARKMDATNTNITFNKITFNNDGKQRTYETNAENVIVVGSSGSHDHGSSKVKLRNIVDYKWEVKHYNGRLVASHIGGKYVAYAIKVGGKDGKIEGMVRVVTPANGHRALIRGKTSEVLDLQFAHLRSQVLLASIEVNALHVHKIETVQNSIVCTDMLKLDDPMAGYSPKYDRVHWCPYVPDNENEVEGDVGKLLVWTRGEKLQCYNIDTIVENYGMGTQQSKVTDGYIELNVGSNITGATLSPDGTTMAVTYESGEVHFYQVYFGQAAGDEPQLLHQWKPHGGKPVTGLFFLDDHSGYGISTLWRFAITMSDNNTEYKVWCCASWECVQTLRFESNDEKAMCFNAEIDPTSNYLLLTDTAHRCLYVAQLGMSGEKSRDDAGASPMAFIKSISEFPVSLPILSFSIVDASVRKYKCAYDDVYLLGDLEDYDDDAINRYCVVIHMFSVQPKSVQECHVLFQPSLSLDAEVGSTLSALADDKSGHDLAKHSDKNDSSKEDIMPKISLASMASLSALMPVKTLADSSDSSDASDPQRKLADSKSDGKSASQQSINKPLNLLTPDSFQATGKTTPEGVSNEVYTALRMLAGESKKELPTIMQKLVTVDALDGQVAPKIKEEPAEQSENGDDAEEKVPLLNSDEGGDDAIPSVAGGGSVGSSPSREVQDILSQKDSELNDNSNTSADTQDDDSDASGNNGEALDGNDDEKIGDTNDVNYNILGSDTAVILSSNGPVITAGDKKDWPDAPILGTGGNLFQMANATEATHSSAAINEMNGKLDRLLDIIQKQNGQIAELKSEVAGLKVSHSAGSKAAIVPAAAQSVDTAKIETRLTRLVEEYLSRYEREYGRKLDAFARTRDAQLREIRETMFMQMAPALCTQITAQLSQVLLAEIQKSLYPIVSTKLDAMKAQVQSEIAQKMTVTDRIVKENIANMCRSKETMDTFGNAVANAVRNGMHHVYVDSLKTIILPAYEKANAELFKQLYDTFNKGTIAYTNQLAGYTKTYEPIHAELVKLMRTIPDQMRNMNDMIVNSCSQRVTNEVNKDLKSMQSNLLKNLKENLKLEIKKGFEAQAASLEDSVLMAVRSTAQTPAPNPFDIQEQIRQLIIQNQINKAFHQALLANDLQLVEYVLERADYSQVFNPCPLEQTVLLSLVQQISADMSNHSELKQKYLSDAIINLNMRDPITREHAPKVLIELANNCHSFVAQNPQSPLCSGVRMLTMAVQGVNASAI